MWKYLNNLKESYYEKNTSKLMFVERKISTHQILCLNDIRTFIGPV